MTEDRRTFIGGSDVAGILGLSPWSSPWSVWAEKTGRGAPDHTDEMTERMAIGLDAERFLADVFNRHHGDMDARPGQGELEHVDYPHLRGHWDGIVTDLDGVLLGGWEAKTSNDLTPWDEIPAFYQCQSQVYMMLSGINRWWFTVGFAGWKVKHYVVLADADDQAFIAKTTEQFWNDHVLADVAPDADAHPATTSAIRRAYNTPDADDVVYADEELQALCTTLRTVRADAKAIEAHQADLENRIKARMADGSELRYGDMVLATWKPQNARRVDVDRLRAAHGDLVEQFTNTTTNRVFRLKSPKGD
jgi:putative phage-type endonuclease